MLLVVASSISCDIFAPSPQFSGTVELDRSTLLVDDTLGINLTVTNTSRSYRTLVGGPCGYLSAEVRSAADTSRVVVPNVGIPHYCQAKLVPLTLAPGESHSEGTRWVGSVGTGSYAIIGRAGTSGPVRWEMAMLTIVSR